MVREKALLVSIRAEPWTAMEIEIKNQAGVRVLNQTQSQDWVKPGAQPRVIWYVWHIRTSRYSCSSIDPAEQEELSYLNKPNNLGEVSLEPENFNPTAILVARHPGSSGYCCWLQTYFRLCNDGNDKLPPLPHHRLLKGKKAWGNTKDGFCLKALGTQFWYWKDAGLSMCSDTPHICPPNHYLVLGFSWWTLEK